MTNEEEKVKVKEKKVKEKEVDFNVFVGAETGILKGVHIHRKGNIAKNFHNLKSLEKQFEITCLSFGDGEGEILMGLRNQTVKVYDVAFRSFSQCVETPGGLGPLVGVARHDGTLVTASEGGVVSYWKYGDTRTFDPIDVQVSHMGKLRRKEGREGLEEEEEAKHRVTLREGRTLARLVQCREEPARVALGGRETDLQAWDLARPDAPIFRAKNVRPDMLQLRQEVWVSDLAWLTPHTVAAVTRYGQIRKYDLREGQRRPVGELVWEEESKGEGRVACSAVAPLGEGVIVGTTRGKLGLWDWRAGAGYKGLVRKFGGCVGSVKQISTQQGNKYFAAVGLDRFLRVWEHGAGGKLPRHKLYLKSRLNAVLMTKDFDPEAEKVEVEGGEEGVRAGEEEVEVLDSSLEEVTEVKEEEEEEDDIWDNMVVIDNKKKRKTELTHAKSKKLK